MRIGELPARWAFLAALFTLPACGSSNTGPTGFGNEAGTGGMDGSGRDAGHHDARLGSHDSMTLTPPHDTGDNQGTLTISPPSATLGVSNVMTPPSQQFTATFTGGGTSHTVT